MMLFATDSAPGVTKTQVYKTTILTVLLYAMECVTLYSRHIKALTRVQLRDLRQRLQRIRSQDRVLDLEVLKREKTNSVEAIITHAQLPWAGHVRRMDDNRLPKVVIYGELRIGKRKQGGQKIQRCNIRALEEDANHIGMT